VPAHAVGVEPASACGIQANPDAVHRGPRNALKCQARVEVAMRLAACPEGGIEVVTCIPGHVDAERPVCLRDRDVVGLVGAPPTPHLLIDRRTRE
jgi:hypothetical protein